MEEYINLYHQKLWEIAFTNVLEAFVNPNAIFLFIIIFIIYVSRNFVAERKNRFLKLICISFLFFISSFAVEYVYSYDKIMSPHSTYNFDIMLSKIKFDTSLPILKDIYEIPIASVDGKLKRKDIIMISPSNPTYYDSLFGEVSMFFSGSKTVGKDFLVALVGYKEKDGEWQSVDSRLAPGIENKDFQKFSKVLHIDKDDEDATFIVYNLQKCYEHKFKKEKIENSTAYE